MSSWDVLAEGLGLTGSDVIPWGPGVAKVSPDTLWSPAPTKRGRLVLVSAITPTSSGEGKTTIAIGLTQGLNAGAERAVVALRQPSLAPVLGLKGGGAGTGRSRVEPAQRVDLHLTGDLHAVGAAHNLLSAGVDDAIFRGRLGAAPESVTWRRVVDIGDRGLRAVTVFPGGKADGVGRVSGFDVTASSEVMAILALATGPADLVERLGRVVVALSEDGSVVTARDLGLDGAMGAILADALLPNLLATTEGAPALLHAGPFANVAHGCSSVIATQFALAHADWVVTEAGFGFDLGGEKFLDLKAPVADVWPDLVVIVVTLKALAAHGGAKEATSEAVLAGLSNLDAHVAACRAFGLEPVVAINVFPSDTQAGLTELESALVDRGLRSARCTAASEGTAGGLALAELVRERATPGVPRPLFADDAPLRDKLDVIVRRIHGGEGVVFTPAADADLARIEAAGFGRSRVCIAKTPLSLSSDPTKVGRPTGHVLTVRGLRAMPGAGHVVALGGDILTMPGLPEHARARSMGLDARGRPTGLDD